MEFPKPYQITNGVWMVPCRIATCPKSYLPLSSPYSSSFLQNSSKLRNAWKPNEDKVLKMLVKKLGASRWSSLAKEFNSIIHDSAPVRKGKQLRERWINQLDPRLIRKNWTKEEDNILIKLQSKLGNKWSEISKLLHGRTENQIKNRWKLVKKNFSCDSSRKQMNYLEIFEIGRVEPNKKFRVDDGESEYSLDQLEKSFTEEGNCYCASEDKLNSMSPIRMPSFNTDIENGHGLNEVFNLSDTEFDFGTWQSEKIELNGK